MSRSNYDKPFYVDVGTSVVAIRCASNHDVVVRYDLVLHPHTLNLAEDRCDRMNREAEIGRPRRNCDRFDTVKDAAIAFARERQDAPQPCPDFTFSAWLLAPATEQEGGAK